MIFGFRGEFLGASRACDVVKNGRQASGAIRSRNFARQSVPFAPKSLICARHCALVCPIRGAIAIRVHYQRVHNDNNLFSRARGCRREVRRTLACILSLPQCDFVCLTPNVK